MDAKLKKKKKKQVKRIVGFFKGFKMNPESSLFLSYRSVMWVMSITLTSKQLNLLAVCVTWVYEQYQTKLDFV